MYTSSFNSKSNQIRVVGSRSSTPLLERQCVLCKKRKVHTKKQFLFSSTVWSNSKRRARATAIGRERQCMNWMIVRIGFSVATKWIGVWFSVESVHQIKWATIFAFIVPSVLFGPVWGSPLLRCCCCCRCRCRSRLGPRHRRLIFRTTHSRRRPKWP